MLHFCEKSEQFKIGDRSLVSIYKEMIATGLLEDEEDNFVV